MAGDAELAAAASGAAEIAAAKIGRDMGRAPGRVAPGYLDKAPKQQGLTKAPASFKQTWSEGGYDFEVRVHPADPKSNETGSIYRVARRAQAVDGKGQGSGWEYLDEDGAWQHTSVLKPGPAGQPNPKYNDAAARGTHIPLPQ